MKFYVNVSQTLFFVSVMVIGCKYLDTVANMTGYEKKSFNERLKNDAKAIVNRFGF